MVVIVTLFVCPFDIYSFVYFMWILWRYGCGSRRVSSCEWFVIRSIKSDTPWKFYECTLRIYDLGKLFSFQPFRDLIFGEVFFMIMEMQHTFSSWAWIYLCFKRLHWKVTHKALRSPSNDTARNQFLCSAFVCCLYMIWCLCVPDPTFAVVTACTFGVFRGLWHYMVILEYSGISGFWGLCA